MNTSLTSPAPTRSVSWHTGIWLVLIVWAAVVPDVNSASTALWIGNPGVTTSTNWSDNANWSGGVGYSGNDVIFGGTGSVGAQGTANSLADVAAQVNSIRFTNIVTNAISQYHTVVIPSGTTLNNVGGLTVGGLTNNNQYATVVNFTGGGTLLQNGFVTVGNNGASGANTGCLLDLSGLNNFVMSATGTNTLTMGLFNRSGAQMLLAGGSNYINCATLKANTDSSSSGIGNQTFTLGAGTNVIYVNTFNVGLNRATCTVNFPATGGLRLRGTGGTDADRTSMTLGNHNATGTGSTAAGTFNFNGHPVDMKVSTLTLGQSSAATTGGSNPGNGTILFDTGTLDATTINMATAGANSFNSANGTITVGESATLIAGAGGISMANLTSTATAANGLLTVNGGLATISGNISKANASGVATITLNPGSTTPGRLVMNALTNTIGTPSVPIDNFNMSDSALTVPAFSGNPSVQVINLSSGGSSNVINITTVPGLGQFQIIAYSVNLGSYNFSLGTLPGGYQGYLSNNTASVDLVITSSLAKTDTWRGNLSGIWNTATANWVSGNNPATFTTGDIVIFDDTLTGTPNVTVTNPVSPGQISVNNSSPIYVISGAGKVTGTGSLTKDGTGSLTLSSTGGDDFSGGIVVNNGTVVLDNTNSSIGGGLAINGGTVRIGNNDGNGALPGGAVTDNGSLVFARTTPITVAVAITGSGTVSQSGSGTTTFTGANSYTGNTVVNGGTLTLSGAGTVSNSLQVQVSNAGLNVSAVPQSLVTGLNLTNSSVTVALNAANNPQLVANTLALGGANNSINLTAIPAIASYPVTFTVIQSANPIDGTFNATLGTVPVATPTYAGSVSQSGNNVVVTLTAGPVGTRPSVSWVGSDVPNLNTNWSDRLNWQLPGPPANGDTVLFSDIGTYFSSSLLTAGGGASVLQSDQINNLVDADFSISSLTFTNMNGSYHNTHIADGKTLSVTNSGGLAVGSLTVDVGAANSQFVNISGPQGTVNVNNPNAIVTVAMTSASSGVHRATLDMSALGTFQANASRVAIGSLNTTSTRPLGTAYLAGTNVLTLAFNTAPGFTAQSDLRGLGVGDQADAATTTSRAFVYFGQTNRINVNSVGIGVGKASGTLQFNPTLTAANSNPTAWFRASDGVSAVAWWTQGDALGQTGASSAPNGVADFSGGTINALVSTMYLGRSPDGNNTGSANCSGTFTYDNGLLNVSNLIVGFQPRAISDAGVGTLNVGINATLIASNLTLALATGGGGAVNTTGTLNITNGAAIIASLTAGTNSSISHINLSGGRLTLNSATANTLGTLDLTPLGTADNFSNNLTLAVSLTPAIAVSTLNVDATTTTTNVVNVGSVNGLVSFPSELPLIQYSVMNFTVGSTFNIGLGSLPGGYTGYLTNDTASSLIGLVIVSAPPKPAYIASFGIQGGNLVASGTNGYAGQTYYIVASTNLALPRHSWPRIATNTFDVNGNFTQTLPLTPAIPARFFSVQVQ